MKRIQLGIVVAIVTAACSVCAPAAAWGQQAQPAPQTTINEPASSLHQLYGTISRIDGSQLTIEARNQRTVRVDATAAIKSSRVMIMSIGRAVNVLGSYDEKGVMHAQSIQRAKSSQAGWPPDR
jgi:hypothetical protein